MERATRVLWEKAREGDREAYDRLFALHADRLILFVRIRLGQRLRSKVETQDVLQEAYLAAHRDFERFEYEGEESFLRWLCRVVENRIRDLGDRFGARKRQTAEIPRTDPTGPVTSLEREDERERIRAALEKMEPSHREVLLHRYFEGLTSAEAGERMGRSPEAVRKLTARALAELGRRL